MNRGKPIFPRFEFKHIEVEPKDKRKEFYQKKPPAEDIQKHLNNMLIRAAKKGDLEGIKQAVERGADVNAKDEFSGKYVIELAFIEGDLMCVDYLKRNNANGDLEEEKGLKIIINEQGVVEVKANEEYVKRHFYPYLRLKEALKQSGIDIADI
ncbi:MAG: ankyrin repeat domain-containing protein [Candidatus Anstonellaceae archaeon]